MSEGGVRKVNHFWNDPDGDGHDCVDCKPLSIWKCDPDAHQQLDVALLKRTVMGRMRAALIASAQGRRRAAPQPRGLQ